MPECINYTVGLFVRTSIPSEIECLVCIRLISLGIAREFASVAERNLLLT
jgi:hypothetical protein